MILPNPAKDQTETRVLVNAHYERRFLLQSDHRGLGKLFLDPAITVAEMDRLNTPTVTSDDVPVTLRDNHDGTQQVAW